MSASVSCMSVHCSRASVMGAWNFCKAQFADIHMDTDEEVDATPIAKVRATSGSYTPNEAKAAC